MGIPSEMRDAWINRRKSLLIPSPYEEEKIAASRRCTQEGVRAGTKAAAIACVVTTVPTLQFPPTSSLLIKLFWSVHGKMHSMTNQLEQNHPFIKKFEDKFDLGILVGCLGPPVVSRLLMFPILVSVKPVGRYNM
ncbi:uncharacterized protein LOC122068219 isoform X1 [Macadamia integrifolia]|uniref:uncharacterized protein LOC122068219 isoform X1 n=1 Tax=Macadamia integrifolia TaxID=60698 RepID=UPI001C4E5026|nr:uncharacterized protein LOC122068219 isoform X1 [Macadamia integrifolia]XP_042488019.1 uncharacterized protein LOC122068219 isoform X1 [Macadamia integrifolia]XP_042488020.1 uncharacterized protein LOC122068219 isoform X1 [Macadamia integrifolia]